MEFVLSLAAMFIAFVAMLAINYFIYKREKSLLEINEKYKSLYSESLDELVNLKKTLSRVYDEKEAYREAIDNFVEKFNSTYSNTKLYFVSSKCRFIIEDIDTDEEMPTEEEITQQAENNGQLPTS